MSEINVMDASALIALLRAEAGETIVSAALLARPSKVSTVNYCEVISKFCERGTPVSEIVESLDDLEMQLLEFNRDLAISAAALRQTTKSIGASLGDRACLASASAILNAGDAPVVYTADQQWTTLRWPFKIVVIR